MTEPYRYIDPDGDVLEVHSAASGVCLIAKDMADGESVCIIVTYAALEGLARALLEKAGFPAAELVTPVGSDSVGLERTTPDGEWEPYTDPREAAKAAAWAVAGSEFA